MPLENGGGAMHAGRGQLSLRALQARYGTDIGSLFCNWLPICFWRFGLCLQSVKHISWQYLSNHSGSTGNFSVKAPESRPNTCLAEYSEVEPVQWLGGTSAPVQH